MVVVIAQIALPPGTRALSVKVTARIALPEGIPILLVRCSVHHVQRELLLPRRLTTAVIHALLVPFKRTLVNQRVKTAKRVELSVLRAERYAPCV